MHRFLGLILLLASLAVGWVWMDYRAFETTPLQVPDDGAVVVLPPGGSVASLAEDLVQRGYLRAGWAWYLRWLAWSTDRAGRLKAGEYRLEPGTGPGTLLDLLVSGKVIQYPLAVIEGWTFRQMLEAVRAHEAIRPTLDGLDDAGIMARLGRPGEHPEGRFYPDTYHFPRGTTDVEFLTRAYRRMQAVVDEAWTRRAPDLPYASPYEALVLASIVEKESAVAGERGQIAGVFVRRLRKGMRLQADPTVIYGLGGEFDGNLRRRHLETDTPYNTYTRTGLPPTPICLPGGDALRAALAPAEGTALYFVARGDGTHHFSPTLDEHQRAVTRYQVRKSGRAE
jgi:UPF0755 protein